MKQRPKQKQKRLPEAHRQLGLFDYGEFPLDDVVSDQGRKGTLKPPRKARATRVVPDVEGESNRTPAVLPATSNRERMTVNLPEVAKKLGIGRTTCYELAARGGLPVRVIRIGRRLLVSRSELERFLDGREGSQSTQPGASGPAKPGMAIDARRVAV